MMVSAPDGTPGAPAPPRPERQDLRLPCGAGRLRVRMASIRVVPILLGTLALAGACLGVAVALQAIQDKDLSIA